MAVNASSVCRNGPLFRSARSWLDNLDAGSARAAPCLRCPYPSECDHEVRQPFQHPLFSDRAGGGAVLLPLRLTFPPDYVRMRLGPILGQCISAPRAALHEVLELMLAMQIIERSDRNAASS
jgi:hypothetical protein